MQEHASKTPVHTMNMHTCSIHEFKIRKIAYNTGTKRAAKENIAVSHTTLKTPLPQYGLNALLLVFKIFSKVLIPKMANVVA